MSETQQQTQQVKHDYLQFEEGGAIVDRVGWNGPWPPPEVMVRAVGRISGSSSVTEPENIERSRALHRDFDDHVVVTYYQRRSHSMLPDDMDFTHVARGALYTPRDRRARLIDGDDG